MGAAANGGANGHGVSVDAHAKAEQDDSNPYDVNLLNNKGNSST